MKLLVSLIIIAAGYYSFSYGVFLWKSDNNKLAGVGVFLITLLGVIVPIVDLYITM